MNARKHVAGFLLFSVILGSAILINNLLRIPRAYVPPVYVEEVSRGPVRGQSLKQPVNFRVRQVSLDYINHKSYVELSLYYPLDRPAPERVWVTTDYRSPDSTRAESWTIVTEIVRPFDKGNGEFFVVTDSWQLPPMFSKPGASYFARVGVSSEFQGQFYPPDYHYSSDPANALPVVVQWPRDRNLSRAGAGENISR